MFRFRHFLLLILPLLAVGARAATPKELFDAAARATGERGGASFRFEITGSEPMRGSATARTGGRIRIEAEGLTVWSDGVRVVVADAASRTLLHSTVLRAGLPLLSRHSRDVADPFARPARWADLLSYRPKLAGTSEVRGVRCNVAELLLPGGGGWRWHFGADDHLLRREERLRPDKPSVVDYFDLGPPRDIGAAPKAAKGWATREFMPAGPAPGTAAPQFAVQTFDGKTFSLAAQRGRVVIVDFWATWCGPCRASMPLLQKTYEELHAKGVDVIGLTWNESGDAKGYAAKNGIRYPMADGMEVAKSYGVEAYGIPVVFVIGRDGRVADFAAGWTGERGEKWLRDAVNAALRRGK